MSDTKSTVRRSAYIDIWDETKMPFSIFAKMRVFVFVKMYVSAKISEFFKNVCKNGNCQENHKMSLKSNRTNLMESTQNTKILDFLLVRTFTFRSLKGFFPSFLNT